MSRTSANQHGVPALMQGVIAVLGLAFLAVATHRAMQGDFLGALGSLFVTVLAGAAIYLARTHSERPPSRQRRTTQIALYGIFPLAVIVQILSAIF